jgi:long-chain acyl-CoA synthetase
MAINPFKTKQAPGAGFSLIPTGEPPLTIPEMLAETSARFGRKIGYRQKVKGRWETLTCEQFWRQANEFAAGLVALGLERGDRVAIICESGLPWIIGYSGLSIAGAVGVPLYTDLKSQEVDDLIKHSGARFIIVSARALNHLGDRLPAAEKVIVVGTEEARPGQASGFLRRRRPDVVPFHQVAAMATEESRADLADRRVEPDDLASIVFTSGTTGGMKGVMLTHKNFMSNVRSVTGMLPIDEKDRILLVLPMHHAFPFTIFLACTAFGIEITFENDLLRAGDRLQETKATLFLGVPALFEQMYRTVVRRAEAEGRLEMFERGLRAVDVIKRRTGVNLGRFLFRPVHQQLGGHLRFMLSGGAALNPEIARNCFRLGLPLIQGWGLTEAAPGVAMQRWIPSKFFFSNYYEEHAGSVGPAFEGVDVQLIDVPEKETYVHLHGEGELVVRGPNVFAGYWQDPEATRAAMAGEWLRTGDLGRIDEEGNIWITGRSKYVIVLESGEKVVPDELEERFTESELLQDVCVVARRNRNKTQVGAIVYPNLGEAKRRQDERGEPMTEDSVRKAVQEEIDAIAKEMAPYKRVNELILTDTPLPKTPLLKIARGHLPESHSFDLKRWEQVSQELVQAAGQEAQTAADSGDPTQHQG